jgi:NHL repeat-containing protein
MMTRYPTPTVPAVLAALLIAGCGGKTVIEKPTEDSFFPSPPDLPRVQYLRAFNGSPDFKPKNRLMEYLAGTENQLQYEIMKPFSVASSKGRIYVTDSFGLQGVNVFDLEHQRFYVLGRNPGAGELKKPIHVFADEEGYKYVSDLQRKQVVLFGPDDSYVKSYGDGSSFLPGSCVAHGNEVYVLDTAKEKLKDEDSEEYEERRDQIVVLDKESGKALRRIGRHAKEEDGFYYATFLAIDRLGNIYVSDTLNFRVVKMDPQGNVLASFGKQGDRAGDFAQPKGIAVDKKGLIYVVDTRFQAVQVFDNGGAVLFALGGPTAPKGPLNLPAGVWIDDQNLEYFKEYYAPDFVPEYLIYVANQLGTTNRQRVNAYAFGKRKGVQYPGEESIRTLEQKPGKPLYTLPVLPPEPKAPPAKPVPSAAKEKSG